MCVLVFALEYARVSVCECVLALDCARECESVYARSYVF